MSKDFNQYKSLYNSIPLYLIFPNNNKKISRHVYYNLLLGNSDSGFLISSFRFISIGYGENIGSDSNFSDYPRFNLNFTNFESVEEFLGNEIANENIVWKNRILNNFLSLDYDYFINNQKNSSKLTNAYTYLLSRFEENEAPKFSKYPNKRLLRSIIIMFLDENSSQKSFKLPKEQIVIPILLEDTISLSQDIGSYYPKFLDDYSLLSEFLYKVERLVVATDPNFSVDSFMDDRDLYRYWTDKNSPIKLSEYLIHINKTKLDPWEKWWEGNEEAELLKDIKEVDQILLTNKAVTKTNYNQIRFFLNGNTNSHLYKKFSDKHKALWGKYPNLDINRIESLISKQQIDSNSEFVEVDEKRDPEAPPGPNVDPGESYMNGNESEQSAEDLQSLSKNLVQPIQLESSLSENTIYDELEPYNLNEDDSNLIKNSDENIFSGYRRYRMVYLSNKFRKSIQNLDQVEKDFIDKLFEDIEKAPKEIEFLQFLKRLRVNKTNGYYKIRVRNHDVQRIVFSYDNIDGYSEFKVIDYIPDHKFDYLRDIKIDRLRFSLWSSNRNSDSIKIPLLNTKQRKISRDLSFPQAVFGAAGSGKTSISLDKYLSIYKQLIETSKNQSIESIIYLTFNPKMAEDVSNQIREFFSNPNVKSIDKFFLDLLQIETKSILSFDDFDRWFESKFTNAYDKKNKDISKTIAIEEPSAFAYTYYRGIFKGKLSESTNNVSHKRINKEELFKQLKSENLSNEVIDSLWEVFIQYEEYINSNNLMHDNDIAFEVLSKIEKYKGKFECIIVDETQDLTQVQIYTLLKLSKNFRIYFFGDTNQTINPTIFNIGLLNSTVFMISNGTIDPIVPDQLTQTYRSSKGLVEYTNHLVELRKKWIATQGYGLDYLHESVDEEEEAHWAARVHNPEIIDQLIRKTLDNPNSIVLVPNHKLKLELLNKFELQDKDQNRIYTIFEAKGLEWESVLVYKFVGSEIRKFSEMIQEKASKSTIHRMVFNKYYVACTRARKATIILEDFNYKELKDNLFLKIIEINEIELANKYFNNDNSPSAWLMEAKNLFSQFEYRKARISFQRVIGIEDNYVQEMIKLCSELENASKDKTIELDPATILELKRKKHFDQLINYYSGRNKSNNIKLINLHKGDNYSDQELSNLILNLEMDELDDEIINKIGFENRLDNEIKTFTNNIMGVIKK